MLTRKFVSPGVVLSLAIVLAAFLAACGGDDATPTPTQEPEPTQASEDAGTGFTDGDGEAMAKEDSEAMAKEDGDAMMDKEDGDAMAQKLPDKIRAPHFVDSDPEHGETLAQLPDALVLNFNFSLHSDSSIALTRDGGPVSLGPVTISDDTLSLRAQILDGSADGIYQANYRACWPDQSCHDGSIAFIVGQTS